MEDTTSPQPPPDPLDLATALRRVLGSGRLDTDAACPEALEILDEYAERMLAGEDVSECLPIVKQHLDECPDCCAECDALLRVLRFGSDDPIP